MGRISHRPVFSAIRMAVAASLIWRDFASKTRDRKPQLTQALRPGRGCDRIAIGAGNDAIPASGARRKSLRKISPAAAASGKAWNAADQRGWRRPSRDADFPFYFGVVRLEVSIGEWANPRKGRAGRGQSLLRSDEIKFRGSAEIAVKCTLVPPTQRP